MIEERRVGRRSQWVSFLGIGVAGALAVGCGDDSAAPDDAAGDGALDAAFAALGGEGRIAGLATLRIDSSGTRKVLGEQFAPEDEAAPGSTFQRTVSADLAHDSLRNDVERTVTWEMVGVPHEFSEIVRGELGHVLGVDNLFGVPQGDLLPDGTAAIRREHRLLHPHVLLREVAADPSLATDAGSSTLDGAAFRLVEVADAIHPLTLYVSVDTGRIERLSTLGSDPLLRDVAIDVHYADWTAESAGMPFPRQVALSVDGEVLLEETRGSVEANVALDGSLFAFPADADPAFDEDDARRGAARSHYHQQFAGIGLRPAIDGLQTMVVATELAPGVFHLTGGTHHSMAVEQADAVVLVEGPLHEARSQALLSWASARFPGKPVGHVVATHFHVDHAAGLRELVAAGATLVAGASSEPLYRRVLSAPSALVPDGLEAATPMEPSIALVSDAVLELPDAAHPMRVRRLPTGHAEDMLVVILPEDGILFESDFFNPGGVNFKEAQKLLRDDMVAHDLTGYTIVGGHGTGPVTFEDLESDLAAP